MARVLGAASEKGRSLSVGGEQSLQESLSTLSTLWTRLSFLTRPRGECGAHQPLPTLEAVPMNSCLAAVVAGLFTVVGVPRVPATATAAMASAAYAFQAAPVAAQVPAGNAEKNNHEQLAEKENGLSRSFNGVVVCVRLSLSTVMAAACLRPHHKLHRPLSWFF